jgi:hypothetical protein
MSELFKKKEEADKRTTRKEIRFTAREWVKVENHARIRRLDPTEFMRRSALSRRADVKIETQIILALHFVVQELRSLNKGLVAGGGNPVAEEMLALIREAGAAMKRIEK